MSVPTIYDSDTLAAAMHAWLGGTAASLRWSVAAGSYTDAITDALLLYGVSTLEEATNIGKVRALARVAVWEAAAAAVASRVDWSRGAERVSGSQEYAAVAAQANRERQAAITADYITSATAGLRIVPLVYAGDIYGTATRSDGEFE